MRQTPAAKARLLLATLLLVNCEEPPAAKEAVNADTLVSVSVPAQATDTTQPIAQRTAVYIEASASEMDSVQAALGEGEAEIVWDDFMWYRAGAYDHLETRGIPILRLVGRRPLTFMVNGAPRRYDLAEATTLDVIVLYDKNREPLIIPPVDIEQADEYFK